MESVLIEAGQRRLHIARFKQGKQVWYGLSVKPFS